MSYLGLKWVSVRSFLLQTPTNKVGRVRVLGSFVAEGYFLLSCLSHVRELISNMTTGQRKQQKSDRFSCKTTTLHVYHTFLYISLPSLHDYNVKRPN